jgi:hypothetical protein
MGNIARKFRRQKKAQERSMCKWWLNADGEPDLLAGPDHDMECVFLGGTVRDPDGCFGCYLAACADKIISIGMPQTLRNVPDSYCVITVPCKQTRIFDAVKDGELPPPAYRLRREDGHEVYYWRYSEDHEREHHANGEQVCYTGPPRET